VEEIRPALQGRDFVVSEQFLAIARPHLVTEDVRPRVINPPLLQCRDVVVHPLPKLRHELGGFVRVAKSIRVPGKLVQPHAIDAVFRIPRGAGIRFRPRRRGSMIAVIHAPEF
jgi:hypothetical protein